MIQSEKKTFGGVDFSFLIFLDLIVYFRIGLVTFKGWKSVKNSFETILGTIFWFKVLLIVRFGNESFVQRSFHVPRFFKWQHEMQTFMSTKRKALKISLIKLQSWHCSISVQRFIWKIDSFSGAGSKFLSNGTSIISHRKKSAKIQFN